MNLKQIGIAAALTLAANGPAHATCIQANAAGTWAAYSAGTTNGDYYWFKCQFSIDTAGKIQRGACTESNGSSSAVAGNVHLIVPGGCTFTAALDFTTFKLKASIDEATLSLDKQTVLGVGTIQTQKFTFNMVKMR